jgi:hypothetical protein
MSRRVVSTAMVELLLEVEVETIVDAVLLSREDE